MKKIFFGAITLMLAMGLNTSCSESQFEDIMQQPQVSESKTMTLDLQVVQSAGTRVEIEDIDGKDAFKVTGWSDKDVVKVFYAVPSGETEIADFIYSAENKTFTGNLPSYVRDEDLKMAYYSGFYNELWKYVSDYEGACVDIPYLKSELYGMPNVDWRKGAPLAGALSVAGNGKVIGTLEPQTALVCIHNTTSFDLELMPMNNGSNYLHYAVFHYSSARNTWAANYQSSSSDSRGAISFKVLAGEKIYMPVFEYLSIVEKSSGFVVAPQRNDLQYGKVYKIDLGAKLNVTKVTPGMGGMVTFVRGESSSDLYEETVLFMSKEEDTEYTATAKPLGDGYVFVNWTDGKDGKVLSTDSAYTFKATDAVSPYANFAIEYASWTWNDHSSAWCNNPSNVTTVEILTEVEGSMPEDAKRLNEESTLWAVEEGNIVKICTPGKEIRMFNCVQTFAAMTNLKEIKGLDKLNTAKVLYMEDVFAHCTSLTSLDLSGFNTENVISMSCMFKNCSSLTTLDLSKFNTSKVERMDEMFVGCTSLKKLDLSGFNTENVNNMKDMFRDCSSLESLDLSGFKTENVRVMWSMFQNCSSLKSLDLSMFNTANVEDTDEMFCECANLSELILSDKFKVGSRYHNGMFRNTASNGFCVVKGATPEVKSIMKQDREWDSKHLCFDNDGTTIPNMNYQEW